MAVHHGSEGLVEAGTDTVSEVTEWSYSESVEVTERKVLLGGGANEPTPLAGSKSGSGTISCNLDNGDNGQDAMDTGDTVAVSLHVGDATTGNKKFSGSVLITGREISNPAEGITTISFNYNGVLTEGTV